MIHVTHRFDHVKLTLHPYIIALHIGIGVRDDEKRTLLHLINGCPPEDNISDMMNMLILR